MKTLILASESPYRRELLNRLKIPYQAIAHQCDERSIPDSVSLEIHAVVLAKAKATSLVRQHQGSFILASDQIAEIDGHVLHKPGTPSAAIEQLQRLSGRQHRLLTAVALHSPGLGLSYAIDIHQMTMRSLSIDEIRRYVDTDTPLDCCGSYKIECLGISLFEKVQGDDASAIVGLPLLLTCQLLRDAGFPLP